VRYAARRFNLDDTDNTTGLNGRVPCQIISVGCRSLQELEMWPDGGEIVIAVVSFANGETED
jgi:hypothetical protein